MTDLRPVILVPHYNHSRQFADYVSGLVTTGVPLLVVDDGSDTDQRQQVQALAETHGFELLLRTPNAGKGDAVVAGFEYAAAAGYTHALQMDADGQHDPADVARFIEAARKRPDTIICGAPVFGDDAPWIRVWGRKLTDAVVFIETWSTGMRDSLCGFRLYPLRQTLELITHHRPAARMDFDADILVKARWHGMHFHFLDTRVIYPTAGVSHFRYGQDNVRMVLMHIRLIASMLVRAPWFAIQVLRGRWGQVTGD
ncbi:MAG: glycosyltransferase family 2 protein [Pseudomonadota bacterium]